MTDNVYYGTYEVKILADIDTMSFDQMTKLQSVGKYDRQTMVPMKSKSLPILTRCQLISRLKYNQLENMTDNVYYSTYEVKILADIDTVLFDQSATVQPQLENMTDNVYYGTYEVKILADIDTVLFDQSATVQPQLENMTDNVYYGTYEIKILADIDTVPFDHSTKVQPVGKYDRQCLLWYV